VSQKEDTFLSTWNNEKVLEVGSGAGCTTAGIVPNVIELYT
jgi:hypothetical protein